jgi:type I restriction enzyme S subunit
MKLDELYRTNAITIQNGFPCGNWNEDGRGVLHLRPFNVTDLGQVDLGITKFVETDKKLNQYLLRYKDVIFNNTNSEELVGKTALWMNTRKAVLSNHMTIVRVADADMAHPGFIAFYLLFKWYEGYFRMVCRRHVNQASVSRERLRDTPFPEFNASEQRRIAAVLSLVQQAIEQQERMIVLTTELKKALMNKLFTEGTRGEPQKQTEIGLIPESWEVVKLGGLADKISKGSSPKWQGFQYVEEGTLFVRSQNVGNGRMDFSDRAYLPEEFNEKEKRSVLREGDILINLVGASIGRAALATREVEGGNCNQAVCFVRINGSDLFKNLIVYFLLSPGGQEQMRRQKKDIARANLSLLDVKGFEIPLPKAEEEVKDTARIFLTLENNIATYERKRDTFKDLFRTLLHQLMTAEIRVNELDLEELGLNNEK